MICEICTLDKELNELNLKTALLKESVHKCILLRDDYIQSNKRSERKLQSLANLKDQYEYLKDILLKENFSCSINSGKRSLLLRHKIKEFQNTKEQTKLKCERLPVFLQLQEINETNENLYYELLVWHEKLGNLRKDYWKVFKTIKSDFANKLIEFSQLQTHKCENNIAQIY